MSKFKVGDWVTYVGIDTFQIMKVYNNGYIIKNDKCLPISINLLEHWQPKSNEHCWFINDTHFELGLVDKFFNDGEDEFKYRYVGSNGESNYAKTAQPFIGDLPYVKDIK